MFSYRLMYQEVRHQSRSLTLIIDVKIAQVLHLQLSLPQLKKMLHLIKLLIFVAINKVKSFQIMKLPPTNEQASMFSAQMSKQTFTNQ